MSLKLLTVAMLAACVALTGCDDQQSDRAVQKLKEFFNAVKPDACERSSRSEELKSDGRGAA